MTVRPRKLDLAPIFKPISQLRTFFLKKNTSSSYLFPCRMLYIHNRGQTGSCWLLYVLCFMVEHYPFCCEIEGEGDTSGKCRKPPYANQTMQTTNNNHRATITTMTINTLFVNIVICGFRLFAHFC